MLKLQPYLYRARYRREPAGVRAYRKTLRDPFALAAPQPTLTVPTETNWMLAPRGSRPQGFDLRFRFRFHQNCCLRSSGWYHPARCPPQTPVAPETALRTQVCSAPRVTVEVRTKIGVVVEALAERL